MTPHPKAYLLPLTLLLVLIFSQAHLAESPPKIERFSDANPADKIPASWEPLNFPKIANHTSYAAVQMDGRTVIRASSTAAASGRIHEMDIDPHQFPWLLWRWRIDHVLEKGDVTTKAGDDCAARIYVAFKYDRRNKSMWERFKHRSASMMAGRELPGSGLTYAWANQAVVGEIITSPYADQSKMIVMQSGNTLAKQWQDEKRNIVEDYRSAFGTPPTPIVGIAIMTDTDNTEESTTAYYGDIRMEP